MAFSPSPYYSQAPQMQQHEVARMRQFMHELEFHRGNLYQQLNLLAPRISSAEDQLQYAGLIQQIRETEASLAQHHQTLTQLLALVPPENSRQISDQVKREIYHYYHVGRYTQEQLASQYGVSQSTVNRIVNGEPPAPLAGINAHSLT